VIEKAKGLLMERERVSEDAAFKLMRNQSMTRRISMAQLAEELLKKNVRPGSP
jgi:response regulator NasT